jgi:glycosyltransferase involved in cell wall biosynthesis
MSVRRALSNVYNRFLSNENRALAKKLRYGYYVRNWQECRKNKTMLKKARVDGTFDSGADPLVSVIVPTYNRGSLLTERVIPSVLAQSYKNFELIVVGDHCTDDTEHLVRKIDDSRVRFVNLPERGKYPEKGYNRWMVAGCIPRNKGLELALGDWIAPLDDDDEFTADHLESLLSFAVKGGFEMVYGMVRMEMKPEEWVNCGSWPLRYGKIAHQAVLYHSRLKFLKYDVNAWKYNEPDDWNLWRRMKDAGARIGFLEKVVGIHYIELKQWNK